MKCLIHFKPSGTTEVPNLIRILVDGKEYSIEKANEILINFNSNYYFDGTASVLVRGEEIRYLQFFGKG